MKTFVIVTFEVPHIPEDPYPKVVADTLELAKYGVEILWEKQGRWEWWDEKETVWAYYPEKFMNGTIATHLIYEVDYHRAADYK